jgi:hypothetical protein
VPLPLLCNYFSRPYFGIIQDYDFSRVVQGPINALICIALQLSCLGVQQVFEDRMVCTKLTLIESFAPRAVLIADVYEKSVSETCFTGGKK